MYIFHLSKPQLLLSIIQLQTVISAIITVIVIIYLQRKHNFLQDVFHYKWRDLISDYKQIFNEYLKSYVLPLQVTHIFSYIKNYAPALIIGSLLNMESVGVYEIAKKIYKLAHTFLPNILLTLIPTFTKKNNDYKAQFREKYFIGSVGYLSIIIILGTFLFFIHPLIMKVFGVTSESSEIKYIFLLFSIDLIVGSFGFTNNLLILIGNSTKILLLTSPLREIVFLVSAFLLVPKLSLIGMALSRLAGTTVITYVFYAHVIKNNMLPHRKLAFEGLALLMSCAILIIVAFIYTGF